MASRIAALSKAKTKAFTHRNREASKFQFELTVHGLKGLDHSLAADLCVQIVRGPKVVVTGAASVAVGAASWEETKTLVCTLHASKKSDVMFSEKTFGVKVLAMKRGVPKSELASAELNLASFATIDARSMSTEHTPSAVRERSTFTGATSLGDSAALDQGVNRGACDFGIEGAM